MNIALLTEKYPPEVGGLAVSVSRLANLLHAAGHGVTVFALSGSLAAGETAWDDLAGIAVKRMGIQRRTDDTLAAWSNYIIQEITAGGTGDNLLKMDVIHGYFLTQAGFVAAYVGRMLGIPSVVSVRGNDLDRAIFDPGKAAHVLFALQRAGAVTANSQELARKVQALSGRTAQLIPNGVDAALFRPLARDGALAAQLGLQGAVIGFSGEARAKKGLAALLLAYRQVAERRAVAAERGPLTLLLAGGVRSGEDKELLKVFRKQHKELPIVVTDFLPLAQMPALYNLMDVVVLPSRQDGLPNALLEAMACARPIVAGRAGGLPDAIRDGENGLLAPPDDVAALVEAIETLLADPDRAAQLGQAARQTALERFTPQQELEKTLEVYQTA